MTQTPIADSIEQPADGYEFPTYPATAIPVEGVPMRGRFVRLDRGPENEYGIPWIAVFDAVDGLYRPATNAEPLPLELGARYGLWLIHSVLRERLRELRPAAGELFAVLYTGKRGVRNDPKRSYYAYQVDMPERAASKTAAGWDDVDGTGADEQPDF